VKFKYRIHVEIQEKKKNPEENFCKIVFVFSKELEAINEESTEDGRYNDMEKKL